MIDPRSVVEKKTQNQLSAYFDTRGRVRWTSSLKRLTEDAAQEYEGRFLIELIQNAYDANDAGSTDGRIDVQLDLSEGDYGVLYVANTGRAFSETNFDAITDIAQSDKPPGEGIGNKGVGFKSVLQVAEWPEVYSAPAEGEGGSEVDGFCFRFATPSDVQLMLPDAQEAQAVLDDVSPYLLPVLIEEVPSTVRSIRARGYCTVVRLPLRSPKAAATAERDVRELATSKTPVLLFLDRISKLSLRIRGASEGKPLETVLDRAPTPIQPPTDESLGIAEVDLGRQGTFLIFTRKVDHNALRSAIEAAIVERQIDARWAKWKQEASVSVAARLDGLDVPWRLYTFLPMDNSPSPLAAHANAPFFTKMARSSVSLDVALNDFLLNEIAHLCVAAAFWLRGADTRYAPLCVDMITWTRDHLDRLRAAFIARGLKLETAELVPLAAASSRPFGAVQTVRRWDGFSSPLAMLTTERLCGESEAELIDPFLGARLDRFSRLRQALRSGDEGRPSASEASRWCEQVAASLRNSAAVPHANDWMSLYEDLAVVFSPSGWAKSLTGRRLILDDKNRLQPFLGASEEEAAGPTMFFWPARDRTEGEEDVENSLDLTPPRALARSIAFTNRDLDWYVQEGPRRTARRCRKFFEDAGLIRRYRTQDVLEAVGRILTSRRTEAVLQEALFFVFRLRDRTSGKPALDELGLHVPTTAGWVPAREALFGTPWPKTMGTALSHLIQTTASVSPSMTALEARFLRPPDEWLPQTHSIDEWTTFLSRLGVRDGLWPIEVGPTPFRRHGADFTPMAWGLDAKLDDTFIRNWASEVPGRDGFPRYPQTTYTSVGDFWALPGQFDHASFPANAQNLYASLVVAGLSSWPDDVYKIGVRRENYPGEVPTFWPTPLESFLRHARWVPVTTPDLPDPVCRSPEEAWLFDDDQPDAPPPFAPLIPRTIRRKVDRDERANRLLRSLGVRTWNESGDAGQLLHVLYKLLRDDRIPLGQSALFRRQYEQALANALAGGNNPWAGHAAFDLVVSRGQRLETIWLAAEGVETVYVDDGGDALTTRIMTNFDAPIVCARPADGARLAHLLSIGASEQVRRLSEVEVEVQVDGKDLSQVTNTVALVEPGREWLVVLCVAALEFRGGQFRRQTERTLRDAARRLRAIRVVPALDLRISVDGQPVIDPTVLHGVFAVLDETEPLLVIQDYPGELTWSVLERTAPALSQFLRRPEIGSVIFEALVRLGRMQSGAAIRPPTDDELADALGLSATQLQEARQMLQSSIEVLAERLYIALACLVNAEAAAEALPALKRASSEDALIAALHSAGAQGAVEVMNVAKRASTLPELRDDLELGYREFNDALRALDMSPLTDPDGQRQAFDYFVSRHKDETLAHLRWIYKAAFLSGQDLSEYVALRRLPELQTSPTWLEECELQTDSMMTEQIDAWLTLRGAPPLSQHVDEEPVGELRAANRKALISEGTQAGRTVRAWCRNHGESCPALWSGEAVGGQLADWADERGLLDFLRISDLQPLFSHLNAAAAWPDGMEDTLDLERLDLAESDLEHGDSEEEKQRQQQELERTTIEFGGRRLRTEPDRFPEIAEAVREALRPQLLKTTLRLASLAAAPIGRHGLSSQGGNRSFYRGRAKPTNQQLSAIGLAGEVIAFQWLLEQYRDGVVQWRSGYRDMVLGGTDGDDSLGYDIEVVTRASTFMFEVKSSVDDGSDFELTESEVNSARLHVGRDAYRIIYVRNVLDADRTSILLLPNPFTRRGREAYRIVGSGLHYRFAPE